MTQTEIINALSALAEVVKVNIGTAEHKMIKLANDKIAELIPLLNTVELKSDVHQYPPGYTFDFGTNPDSVCSVCGGSRMIKKIERVELRGGGCSEIGTIEPCPACGLKSPIPDFPKGGAENGEKHDWERPTTNTSYIR
jgi:hypothetical protein